jgi:hypothetical protein
MILRLLNDLELERHYRVPLLREFEQRLREHVALEEGVFMESVRAVVRSGVWLLRDTHAEALDGLGLLIELREDPAAFVLAVRSYRSSVAEGIEREETEVFRVLEAGLTDRDLERLTDQMNQRGPGLASATATAATATATARDGSTASAAGPVGRPRPAFAL